VQWKKRGRDFELTIVDGMVWNPAQRVVLLQRQSEGTILICERMGRR